MRGKAEEEAASKRSGPSTDDNTAQRRMTRQIAALVKRS